MCLGTRARSACDSLALLAIRLASLRVGDCNRLLLRLSRVHLGPYVLADDLPARATLERHVTFPSRDSGADSLCGPASMHCASRPPEWRQHGPATHPSSLR